MGILKIRDANGNVQEILVIRGEPGKDYMLTEEDKQEIADMVDETAIEHINSKGNVHGATAAQIGAAPAGFGLGEAVGKYEIVADANTATKSGWYKVHSTTANGVGYVGLMRVDGYSTTNVVQTVYQFNRTDFCPTMQRVCLSGTWGEWEWVNPPMFIGPEYRTTERYSGNVVYAKCVDCEELPVSGQKLVNYTNASTASVVRMYGRAEKDGTAISLPYITVDLSAYGRQISINTNDLSPGWHGYVCVWYTK